MDPDFSSGGTESGNKDNRYSPKLPIAIGTLRTKKLCGKFTLYYKKVKTLDVIKVKNDFLYYFYGLI
ncbi:hypothetical protein FSS13T_10410 [Flavobacterium saliperosum S13]|uniref:Uncharacterized protein n=1 Tax=Flavobacterium saliperosum S13 TaxID=1341155 RepID=A0ABP2ZXW9_9FLAO|nr:hypothetical protein FSS13T_10410 [Flavobacterium saliperosum S13]